MICKHRWMECVQLNQLSIIFLVYIKFQNTSQNIMYLWIRVYILIMRILKARLLFKAFRSLYYLTFSNYFDKWRYYHFISPIFILYLLFFMISSFWHNGSRFVSMFRTINAASLVHMNVITHKMKQLK